jgi:hypothetical protein
MPLTVLGLSGALSHDASAALYVGGKLVAAAEEERFIRDKHAKNTMPVEATKFCLQQAGIEPATVDVVAVRLRPSAWHRPPDGITPGATGMPQTARWTHCSTAIGAIAAMSPTSARCWRAWGFSGTAWRLSRSSITWRTPPVVIT